MVKFEVDVRTEDLIYLLENQYDRCNKLTRGNNGTLTLFSGKYPHWRRFQRDLLSDPINIQSFGYTITHVHKRKMFGQELTEDPDIEDPDMEYSERPEACIITIKPITNYVADVDDSFIREV